MSPATAAARAAQAAPARRAPVRRTRAAAAPARRRPVPQPSRAPHLVPIAVGRRTAAAVSNLADTGLLFRLTRGRLWIGTLTTLLVGIVALNVMELSFGANASTYGRQADILKRENSTLTTRLSTAYSDQSLQQAAGRDGLLSPAPGSIRYLDAGAKNADIAAKRLRLGKLTYGARAAATATASVPPPVAITDTTATTTTDPTATTATDPTATATTDTTATTATAATTTATTPTTTTPATTPTSGGVTAP
jgi:hypothetical protein